MQLIGSAGSWPARVGLTVLCLAAAVVPWAVIGLEYIVVRLAPLGSSVEDWRAGLRSGGWELVVEGACSSALAIGVLLVITVPALLWVPLGEDDRPFGARRVVRVASANWALSCGIGLWFGNSVSVAIYRVLDGGEFPTTWIPFAFLLSGILAGVLAIVLVVRTIYSRAPGERFAPGLVEGLILRASAMYGMLRVGLCGAPVCVGSGSVR